MVRARISSPVTRSPQVIAPCMQPDMREHGDECDDRPALWPCFRDPDILVPFTPASLGER